MKKLLLLTLTIILTIGLFAQEKNVAVVTFYANRYITADESLAGGAALTTAIAKLANDPNFDLKSTLTKFHKAFFEEFAQDFPFTILPENEVIENPDYKNFVRRDTSEGFLKNNQSVPGYNLYDVSIVYKRDLEKLIEIFPDVDGFMFIYTYYEVAPKIAVGGNGTAGISAHIAIKLYNKDSKKVFAIFEGEFGKKTVPLVAGVPVLKLEKIVPACEDASEKLLAALRKKLPKIAKKSGKKL
jgi:hypothetical protein